MIDAPNLEEATQAQTLARESKPFSIEHSTLEIRDDGPGEVQVSQSPARQDVQMESVEPQIAE